jgi:hypothetical protein
MLIPIFLAATVGVFVLRKIHVELFNIAVTTIAVAPIIIGVLLLLAFLLKFAFITIYSIAKDLEESGTRWNIISRIVSKVANPKILLLGFVILLIGFLIYSQVLTDSERLSRADLNAILFSVALTLLIYTLLIFLFSTRHLVIHLITVLWEFLPGALWKLLMLLGLLISQVALLALIYLFVSRFVVPRILA